MLVVEARFRDRRTMIYINEQGEKLTLPNGEIYLQHLTAFLHDLFRYMYAINLLMDKCRQKIQKKSVIPPFLREKTQHHRLPFKNLFELKIQHAMWFRLLLIPHPQRYFLLQHQMDFRLTESSWSINAFRFD